MWVDEKDSVSVVPCHKVIGVREEEGAESRVCLGKRTYRVKIAGIGKDLYCTRIMKLLHIIFLHAYVLATFRD